MPPSVDDAPLTDQSLLDILAADMRGVGEPLWTLLHVYGPQMGEMVWHSIHHDPRVDAVVQAQGAVMRDIIARYGLRPVHRPIRILEVGAYSHYTVHAVAAELGGLGVANDISPAALRVGAEFARARGLPVQDTLVASDFHDLPFADGFFDLVFIASAIHHTFRPWQVLDELFRVLRPGGVLHIENEPVGRLFCLYQFRGNRTERHTPFESKVEELGLTRILSSPFPGSRDEELFGMIENDRIPLGVFLDAFARHAETLALDLNHAPVMGTLEHAALALPRDAELPLRLHALLAPALQAAGQAFTRTDLLLGLSLPPRERLWSLCYAMADALRALPAANAPGYQLRIASIFGAALRGSFRRLAGAESATMLRRALPVEDGVHLDFPQPETLGLDLATRLLPDIGQAAQRDLDGCFPPGDWVRYLEPNGITTLLNQHARPTIRLPALAHGGLLLLRYHPAPQPGAYLLRVLAGEQLLGTHIIAQSEGRLGRFLVPPGTTMVTVELCLPDGTPLDANHLLHLIVAQLVPLRGSA